MRLFDGEDNVAPQNIERGLAWGVGIVVRVL